MTLKELMKVFYHRYTIYLSSGKLLFQDVLPDDKKLNPYKNYIVDEIELDDRNYLDYGIEVILTIKENI